ncbi:hypothetical protein HDU98_005986 [Podochytrium sp. JEL0797]|nr:hypothetical protein HDU98_005986 [Podochytrium sp. JEL0797]
MFAAILRRSAPTTRPTLLKTTPISISSAFTHPPAPLHRLPASTLFLTRIRTYTTPVSSPPSQPDDAQQQKLSIQPRMLIGFTCNKCDTRSHKFMSKKAYDTGVVIVTCDGCEAKHLIADHLGWFDTVGGKVGNIEDIVARMGGDREGRGVVRLRAGDVLTGEGEGEGSGKGGEEGLMEWLPERADAAAGFGKKEESGDGKKE